MKNDEQPLPRIPEWFPEALRVMRQIDSAVAGLDGALRRALDTRGLDPRMASHIKQTETMVRALDGTLSRMDETADDILTRLTTDSA